MEPESVPPGTVVSRVRSLGFPYMNFLGEYTFVPTRKVELEIRTCIGSNTYLHV